MSLVNDLLIEIDRNREDAPRSDSDPLEGLSPSEPRHFEDRTRRRPIPNALFIALAGVIGFGASQLDSSDSSQTSKTPDIAEFSAVTEVTGIADISETELALPRVSAPRPESGLSASLPKDLRIDRPIALRAVRVERTESATRVEIATDRNAQYRIEPGTTQSQFDIVLEGATLREPLPSLDLFGTAIRAFQTQHEDDLIRLRFTLDSDSRVQSQRLEQIGETTLIVDFQPSAQPTAKQKRKAPIQKRSIAKAAAPEQPKMKISRSAGDVKRSNREQARLNADRHVESAREAEAQGDLKSAAALYATARNVFPGHHEAIVQGTAVLSELGLEADALTLISEARAIQPQNPAFLMVHAQLLAKGDVQSAITLLDGAGLSLEAAPKVHTLAAAYLQQSGQHDSAIQRYESILRRFTNRPKIWMGLGISLEARGRVSEAVDAYQISMQLGKLPGTSRGWVAARIDALREES